MNKKLYTWLAVGVAVAVLLILSVLTGAAQDTFGEKPTPMSARELTPAPTPEDEREIAILNLVINSSQEGKVESVTLERGRIVKGYAPNVFGQTGDWTVELVGKEKTVSYGVLDPRHVEVENEQNAEQPFTYIYVPSYEWELVVPLYEDGKDMQIEVIKIYDTEGNQIFETNVDRERWRQ